MAAPGKQTARIIRPERFARVSSIALHDKRLSSRDKLVYVALCEYQNAEGCCWPSVTTLSTISGYGRTAIHEALIVLQSLGYIERQNRLATSNYYHLSPIPLNDLLDCVDNVDIVDQPGNTRAAEASSSLSGQGCSASEHLQQDCCPQGYPPAGDVVFDERTGVLRLANSPSPVGEQKEEERINEITREWKAALCGHLSGIEKHQREFRLYFRHFPASTTLVRDLAEMVKKSSFLCGMNDKHWKCSLYWALKHREKILRGTYTDFRNMAGAIEMEIK